MSSIDWKLVSLGKMALINAKSISGKYPYKEIEYIDTSSVTENEFSPLQRLKLIDAPSRAKRIIQHGDTIISTVRPIQRHFGFIRNPKPNTIASTGFAVITPRNVNPEFLYYYLSQDSITNYLNGIAETSTTTFPAFRPEVLSELEILIPEDENIQRRIAEILSALDDKIELNRQTNATLEAIAQAIFKEWFVNFNFPGATGELVKSELGMIPKGWRVGCLNDILSQEIGGDWGNDFPVVNCIPVISLRGTDLDQLKISGYAPNAPIRWAKMESVQKRKIQNTDILLGGSGLGPIGKSIYCDDNLHDMYNLPIIYSNFCKKLRARTPAQALYTEILLEIIYKSGEMRQFFNGTSIPNLDISSLLMHKIIIPNDDILELYFNIIGKNKFRQLFNIENIILAKIRDSLLPKLMNGEIEVVGRCRGEASDNRLDLNHGLLMSDASPLRMNGEIEV